MDLAKLFVERLAKLYSMCEELAKRESARTQRGMTPPQSLFNRQPFSAQEELPTLAMLLGEVKVEIRPHAIEEQIDGRSFGCVFVDRTLVGNGRMNGYSCWTDLNNPDDDRWYIGASRNTDKPVDEASLATWLQRSGPRPL